MNQEIPFLLGMNVVSLVGLAYYSLRIRRLHKHIERLEIAEQMLGRTIAGVVADAKSLKTRDATATEMARLAVAVTELD